MGLCMAKIFAVLLVIFAFQASVQAADKIRISTPSDAAHFTMHLAQKKGFLKEEGFDADVIVISGPVANVALSNGDTDYFSGFGLRYAPFFKACRSGLSRVIARRPISCCRADLSSKASKTSRARPLGFLHSAVALN